MKALILGLVLGIHSMLVAQSYLHQPMPVNHWQFPSSHQSIFKLSSEHYLGYHGQGMALERATLKQKSELLLYQRSHENPIVQTRRHQDQVLILGRYLHRYQGLNLTQVYRLNPHQELQLQVQYTQEQLGRSHAKTSQVIMAVSQKVFGRHWFKLGSDRAWPLQTQWTNQALIKAQHAPYIGMSSTATTPQYKIKLKKNQYEIYGRVDLDPKLALLAGCIGRWQSTTMSRQQDQLILGLKLQVGSCFFSYTQVLYLIEGLSVMHNQFQIEIKTK
ncbi:MAG: hypothetical protein CL521_03220 [Actinobacteria bacterium]|nr:hypothetical protein [Actinomycetota bacterium]